MPYYFSSRLKILPFAKYGILILIVIGVIAYLVAQLPNKVPVNGSGFDSEYLRDKIPLVEAVKKDCLIGSIKFNGQIPPEGPNPNLTAKDIILRELLIQCRMANRSPFAKANNLVEIQFYKEELPFRLRQLLNDRTLPSEYIWNQYEARYRFIVNGKRIEKENSEIDEPKEYNKIGDLVSSLHGFSKPKNAHAAYKKFCKKKIGLREVKFEDFNEFSNAVKVFPAHGFGKCSDNLMHLTLCSYYKPSEQINNSTSSVVINLLPSIFNGEDFLEFVTISNVPRKSLSYLFPFENSQSDESKLEWLLLDNNITGASVDYKTNSDENCDSDAEAKLVNNLRSGKINLSDKNFQIDPKRVKCANANSALAYRGIEHQINDPDDVKFGYLFTNTNFEVIFSNGQQYSLGYATTTKPGVGIKGGSKSCLSTISVAN